MWFFDGWLTRLGQGAPYQIIDKMMALEAAWIAEYTLHGIHEWRPMDYRRNDMLDNFRAQSKTNSHSYRFVV